MNLVRFNQHPRFSDIFDSCVNHEMDGCLPGRNSVPTTNILENKDTFELDIAVPGMKKEDFKISHENNILTIFSEKKEEKKEEKKNYTMREFSYGTFSRSFTLPESIENEKINAEYKNGILKITLPKKDEAKLNLKKEIVIS